MIQLSDKEYAELVATRNAIQRAIHQLAAVVDAKEALNAACEHALQFVEATPDSAAKDVVLTELRAALLKASNRAGI